MKRFLLVCLIVLGLATVAWGQTCDNPSGASAYEGFGTTTLGGKDKTVYHVTTLANGGAGSLRDALQVGNRCIVFDVAGEIVLTDTINLRGNGITIDGHTAPAAVVVKGYGINIIGPNDPYQTGGAAHDIIIRGLHFHPTDNPSGTDVDAIAILYGAYNIVIDHNTFYGPLSEPYGAVDEFIDVAVGSHDITISWNLMFRRPGGGTTSNLLVNGQSTKVSIHHNLLSDATDKNPIIVFDLFSSAVDSNTTADFVNNYVVAKDGGEGADFGDGAKANIVNNMFNYLSTEAPPAANYRLLVPCNAAKIAALSTPPYVNQWCTAQAVPQNVRHDGTYYIAGNVTTESVPSGYPSNLNDWNTQGGTPFTAPAITTQTAAVAACRVLREAGKRPLLSVEQTLLDRVDVFNDCDAQNPPPVPPPPPPTSGTVNVTLLWDYDGPAVDGFVVERKSGVTGTYSPLVTNIPGNNRTHVDSVLANQIHCWMVRAKKGTDMSTPTSEVCSGFVHPPQNLRLQ